MNRCLLWGLLWCGSLNPSKTAARRCMGYGRRIPELAKTPRNKASTAQAFSPGLFGVFGPSLAPAVGPAVGCAS